MFRYLILAIAALSLTAAVSAQSTGDAGDEALREAQRAYESIEVIQIQGSEDFEKASLDALLRFRYPPRFVDGEAAPQHGVTSRISFMIKN